MHVFDWVERRLLVKCASAGVLAAFAFAAGGTDAMATELSSYAATVASDGAADFWRFDETSGSTFVDSGPDGNDGTFVGSPTLGEPGALTCESETGVNFRLTDEPYGSVAGVSVQDSELTVEAWVWTNRSRLDGPVVAKSLSGVNGRTFALSVPEGKPTIEFFHSGSVHDSLSTIDEIGPGWHHLVGMFDNGDASLFVDGELIDRQTFAFDTLAQNSADVEIGGGDGFSFNGTIDEVALYPTALSDAQIRDHFSQGSVYTEGEESTCGSSLLAHGTVADGAEHVVAYAVPDEATFASLTGTEDDVPLTLVAEADVMSDNSFVLRTDDLGDSDVDGSDDGFVNFSLLTDGGDGSSAAFTDAVNAENVLVGPAPVVDIPAPESSALAASVGKKHRTKVSSRRRAVRALIRSAMAKRSSRVRAQASFQCQIMLLPYSNAGNRWARIGETSVGAYPLTGKFTYTAGATSQFGIAVSASGGVGTWRAGGSSQRSNSTSAAFGTAPQTSNYGYWKLVQYYKYRKVSACPGSASTIDYEVWPYADTGGFATTTVSAWSGGYCVNEPGAGFVWTSNRGRLTTFSTGVDISGYIGINLSASTSTSAQVVYQYTFPHIGKMCGDTNYPTTANRIQSRYRAS